MRYAVIAAVLAAFAIAGCGKEEPKPAAPMAQPMAPAAAPAAPAAPPAAEAPKADAGAPPAEAPKDEMKK